MGMILLKICHRGYSDGVDVRRASGFGFGDGDGYGDGNGGGKGYDYTSANGFGNGYGNGYNGVVNPTVTFAVSFAVTADTLHSATVLTVATQLITYYGGRW